MLINYYTTKVKNQLEIIFPNGRIIRAYPKEFKPIRMDKPIITVSGTSEDVKHLDLGDFNGEINTQVTVGVFVPVESGITVLEEHLDTITACILSDNDCKYQLSSPTTNKTQGTISASIIFTFKYYIGDQ